jgi:hypothetical protein
MHSDLQTGRVREGNVYESTHIVIETLVEISVKFFLQLASNIE